MTERRGRFIRYDKQKVLEEIVSGFYSAEIIAKRNGITRGMVYSLKHAAKKKNIIKDPVQKLKDLDPVEVRPAEDERANEIYRAAQLFKREKITNLAFFEKVRAILNGTVYEL